MRRRQFLTIAAASAAAMASRAGRADAAPLKRRPPNVIYAFSDEHRWQSMSFTELPQVRTPNMARMASEGISFSNCISNYPVCSPYRAMLLTGRWPYQQGVTDNNIPLRADEMTIAKAFKAHGYATGYIGKWHLGGTRAEPYGFDYSLIWDRLGDHWNKGTYFPKDGAPVTPKGYNATLMTDQALEYIEAHRGGPFFLMLSWHPPHANFLDPPQAKKDLYPEGSLPWRPNVDFRAARAKGPGKMTEENAWAVYQGYHGHISAVDDELGRILNKLNELGLTNDTLVVYSSDHGSMMGSHSLNGKRQFYEESLRVPCLMRWPGVIPAGQSPGNLLGAIDVVPTLCGLAGVRAPQSCVGTDFTRVALGKHGPSPESQFIMHISKQNATGGENHPAPLFRGVRTARHTYAVLADGAKFLFDNVNDPYQRRNLAEEPSHGGVRKELHAQLRKWLRRAADPFVGVV